MPPNENTIEAGQMFNFSKLNLSPNRSISRRGQLFRWLRNVSTIKTTRTRALKSHDYHSTSDTEHLRTTLSFFSGNSARYLLNTNVLPRVALPRLFISTVEVTFE
ncbi:predicted protein [Botrytis cinerea T4]|uniref:Uncharacterized protein n=1 Tax=Botryotinia fuckeliana (strain T4) TaxID=999810 RepID=G2YRP4_BOTF4|nr:predicted protein [Botrytis cinerea T4]